MIGKKYQKSLSWGKETLQIRITCRELILIQKIYEAKALPFKTHKYRLKVWMAGTWVTKHEDFDGWILDIGIHANSPG